MKIETKILKELEKEYRKEKNYTPKFFFQRHLGLIDGLSRAIYIVHDTLKKK